jgi:hypothetical protein
LAAGGFLAHRASSRGTKKRKAADATGRGQIPYQLRFIATLLLRRLLGTRMRWIFRIVNRFSGETSRTLNLRPQ